MKLTNEKIVNDSIQLAGISQKELPIKASYAIAKNLAHIESELKIYNKEREKLIEKYSEKDKNGKTIVGENNQINLQKDKLDGWNKDIKELLAIENDVDIHTFPLEVLSDVKNLTPADLMLMDYMIAE